MSQVTKRILLVDDSRIARLTLQQLITSTDNSVEITQRLMAMKLWLLFNLVAST